MFRPRCGFRQKLVYIILNSVLYCSWSLGIFPFAYDTKQRRLHRSKWLIIYGIALSLGLLYLMLKQKKELESNETHLDVFLRNFVLQQISLLMGIVGVLTIITMYVRTFWRSRDLERIYNDIMGMEMRYFSSVTVECPKFDSYVIQKGLIVVGGVASTVLVHFGMPDQSLPLMNILVISLIKMGTFLLSIHFHLGVAFIFRFVWLINRELLCLVNYLRDQPTDSSERVRLLLQLYQRLMNLYQKLTECYDYQTVLMILNFLAANIIVCFYMIVYSISLSKMSFFVVLIMFPLALVNNFLDFWLTVSICELMEKTGQQTSMILKLYNDIEKLDMEMECIVSCTAFYLLNLNLIEIPFQISNFALFCSHRRFKFRHCKLFYVNREMGFQMLVTSVLYLLFLVQFDFMNL
ncbi:hypothetical protein KR009_005337 [Drosophila setifemur]|nr:hypothetical protein KR009_005337 [Drosophila setifemur]